MGYKCASVFLFAVHLGFLSLGAVQCQKSQQLVLSESRKTGIEGSSLQVNCTAHVASPLDSLKWVYMNENHLDFQQAYLTNTTVVMTISSLRGSDAGRYKCMLIMADGREEAAEFELLVRRRESTLAACGFTQFKCKKTKHCIFLRYHCDGKDDCGDGSDEDCEGDPCLNKFHCNNSRCVETSDVCNHVDNCGDLSDEGSFCVSGRVMSTTQTNLEDSHFGWLKITMSTIIASTVGVVILISFITIVVFRLKMKRQREQRIARALHNMYRHGDSREATSSGQGDEIPSDQRPFLSSGTHHYGNIIVNVNNGVQYLPGYDYSLFVAVPPPYSECGAERGDAKPKPPPYSTIDRRSSQQLADQVSERAGQSCSGAAADAQVAPVNISVASVQSCLGSVRSSGLGTATGTTISTVDLPASSPSENDSLLDCGTVAKDKSHGHINSSDCHLSQEGDTRVPTLSSAAGDSNSAASLITSNLCSVTSIDERSKSPIASPRLSHTDDSAVLLLDDGQPGQTSCSLNAENIEDALATREKSQQAASSEETSTTNVLTPTTTCEHVDEGRLDLSSPLVSRHFPEDDTSGIHANSAPSNLPPSFDQKPSIRTELLLRNGHLVVETLPLQDCVIPVPPQSELLVGADTAQSDVPTWGKSDWVGSTLPTSEIGWSQSGSLGNDKNVEAGPELAENSGACPDRFNGTLNVRNGSLVLETPKHTMSSLILSHLKGVYAAEQQGCEDSSSETLEPVVNTKRPPGVVTRPALPTFHSDVVLPGSRNLTT